MPIISENKSANRKMEDVHQQEIGRLETANDDGLERIEVFSDVREHTLLLNRYSSLLHELANSKEVDVRRMVARLTTDRLRAVASELEQYNIELRTSATGQRKEIQSLANVRNPVTSLGKFVGLIGQIAVSIERAGVTY